MVTYGDFRLRLLHALGAEPDTTYTDDLLYESCTGALNAILPYCPNQSIKEILVSTNTFQLPMDCWRVETILDSSTGLVLPKFDLRPSAVRRVSGTEKGFSDWMEYPRGYVLLSSEPSSARTINVFYLAYWDKPQNKDSLDFVLPMPESALSGMIYYAASHCMVPGSVNSAQIRQFNTKVDSGTPVDNSLEMEAKFLRLLFMEEMKSMPKYVGVTQ